MLSATTSRFDLDGHDWSSYMEGVVRGVREHILRMDPATLPIARRRVENLRRLRNLAGFSLTAAVPALAWVLAYHLRRRGAGGKGGAELLALLRQFYWLASLPAGAAQRLLVAMSRRIATFRPLAITM